MLGNGGAIDQRDAADVTAEDQVVDHLGALAINLGIDLVDEGAVFLREIDGLSADETRELLKISVDNLWTRLYRARSLLRDCLHLNWFRE